MTRHRARKPLGYVMCHRGTNEYKCIKPQSSQRTRRTETDLHSDPQSFDPVGQLPNVEIDQQSNRATSELEIREKLRPIDWSNPGPSVRQTSMAAPMILSVIWSYSSSSTMFHSLGLLRVLLSVFSVLSVVSRIYIPLLKVAIAYQIV